MEKHINEKYQESYYSETLSNGLHVVLWKKEDYAKSLFMMSTPLGAMDLEQVDEAGKHYCYHAGIAHFLEHKMFEMGEEDVMELFSRMGANVNAFTSYNETAYYFSTSNDIKKPLELLMNFVQTLQISKESVEKEKGIIVQELNMYQQMPDNRLLMETFSSLFQNHPLKYDIGGDAESVCATTLEELQQCYCRNYHPSNMVLFGIGDFDVEAVMQLIRENQDKKEFSNQPRLYRKEVVEPHEVARKEYRFAMDISIKKQAIAYKLTGLKDSSMRNRMEWCFKIMLDAYFSSLNPEFQAWIDEGIINDYIGSEVDFGEDHGLIMFYGESNDEMRFKDIVAKTWKRMQQEAVDKEMVERLKRRYFGQSLRSLNSFDDIAITYIRNYFEGLDMFDALECIDHICEEDFEQAREILKNADMAYVVIEPENS